MRSRNPVTSLWNWFAMAASLRGEPVCVSKYSVHPRRICDAELPMMQYSNSIRPLESMDSPKGGVWAAVSEHTMSDVVWSHRKGHYEGQPVDLVGD